MERQPNLPSFNQASEERANEEYQSTSQRASEKPNQAPNAVSFEHVAQQQQEDDLKNRIDSSDQDEDASYEELNEDDLKTHSSGEQINVSNNFNGMPLGHDSMNVAAHKSFGSANPNFKPAIAEEDEDDNYSDQYEEVAQNNISGGKERQGQHFQQFNPPGED